MDLLELWKIGQFAAISISGGGSHFNYDFVLNYLNIEVDKSLFYNLTGRSEKMVV